VIAFAAAVITPPVLTGAAVLYVLIVLAALWDIARRPRQLLLAQRRWLWMVITVIVVPAGFALYLLFGRIPPEDAAP
jgi:hypothetical protein